MKNVQFILPNVDLDQACDLLIEWGVLSSSIQNLGADDSPQNAWFDEPGELRWEAWEAPIVVAMISDDTDGSILANQLKTEFNLSTLPPFKESKIKDVDWVRETQKINKPNQITDRLWIIPTDQPPVDQNAANVFLDPGVAFGSGTHPTTHLCLEWLSENMMGGESVLDFGCGSGILAIAALKLGAKSAVGVDIDPVCLNSTFENGKANDVSISTYAPKDLPQAEQFDMIIANILANPLIELMSEFQSRLKEGGHIVISGMMASQTELITENYMKVFSDITTKFEDGWALISGRS